MTRPASPIPPEDQRDLGAWRTATELTTRLGVQVTGETVVQLAADGVIGYGGVFKGWQLYTRADLPAVTTEQVAAAARHIHDTKLLNGREAAARLGVRQADFKLLVRAGLIVPEALRSGKWGFVKLFAPADLAAFAARDDIDWAKVRATPPGRRSALYDLCLPELALQALGGPPPPRVKPRQEAGR
jgi:hypothetical protein